MKVLLYVLLGIVGLILAVLAVGFSLKPEWRVERSVVIEAPAEPVFAYVSILRNWPEWTAWNSKDHPSIKYSFSGPDWGIGATQQWDDNGSNGQLEVTEYIPGEYMEYELIMDKGAYRIRGSLRIESVKNGSRLTWACWGDAGKRPVGKLVALAYRPIIGRAFSTGLENLRARFHVDPGAHPPEQMGTHGEQPSEATESTEPPVTEGTQTTPGEDHGGQDSED